MEQTAAQSAQSRENKIAELERKYGTRPEVAPGASTEATQEPGEPQPQISREEYEVIKSVFERLGCDSLITYSNFFEYFFGFSYEKFLRHQPAALMAIAGQMERETEGFKKHELKEFVGSLELVNGTIYRIVESSSVFDEAEILCSALDEAHYKYELKSK